MNDTICSPSDIINRASLASIPLESPLLVSIGLHRSVARLARGLSVATTLQWAGKGPNNWMCAQDTSSIPAERQRAPLTATGAGACPLQPATTETHG